MKSQYEQSINAETTEGTMKLNINKLEDGRYRVDARFYDHEGYYVASKSHTRYCDTFGELLIG